MAERNVLLMNVKHPFLVVSTEMHFCRHNIIFSNIHHYILCHFLKKNIERNHDFMLSLEEMQLERSQWVKGSDFLGTVT